MAKKNKRTTEKEVIKTEVSKMLNEERIKLFIQMLDVQCDTNMTRIYTAISPVK